MIHLEQARLTNCIVHFVGNKNNDEKLRLSQKPLKLNDDLETQLTVYFLKAFRTANEAHEFHHAIEIGMNEVFACATKLFAKGDFAENAGHIASHLYEQTRHPAVKDGELFITMFDEISLDDQVCKAIGIFKSERKDSFFKILAEGKSIDIGIEQGISQQKLDKACLILHDGTAEGYRVFTYEHANADTEYWRNDFLGIVPKKDNYQHTKNFLSVCKEFVSEKLPQDFEVTKADQIDLLNKSLDYFKKNKDFEMKDFTKEVFAEPELIKSFKSFKNEYQDEHDLEIEESFDVSTPAVKKQVRNYKSVLKLDKNFHVYIHGDRSKIEQGVEKDGRKYYKIYFEKEL